MVIQRDSHCIKNFSNSGNYLIKLVIGTIGSKVTILKSLFFNFSVNNSEIFSRVKGLFALPAKPKIKSWGLVKIFDRKGFYSI
ncbi:MAG TPA: hypothetical protein DCW35_00980 [Polynucleobacter sp.]|nr:hypothetical protein [Polynucleobacter sp.]